MAGSFGPTQGTPFTVKARIVPKAVLYARERIWGDDQSIEDLPGGGVMLTFTSTSELETIAWILSFGGEAELVEPEGLRTEIRRLLEGDDSGARVRGGLPKPAVLSATPQSRQA